MLTSAVLATSPAALISLKLPEAYRSAPEDSARAAEQRWDPAHRAAVNPSFSFWKSPEFHSCASYKSPFDPGLRDMRKGGLEPPRIATLDPKSSASTKFRHFRARDSKIAIGWTHIKESRQASRPKEKPPRVVRGGFAWGYRLECGPTSPPACSRFSESVSLPPD